MSRAKGSKDSKGQDEGNEKPSVRELAPRVGAGRTERPGARSGGPLSPAEAAEDEDMRDLFLSEENLIRLAIGHLGGKMPPRKNSGVRGRPRASAHQPTGPGQPARVRRALAKKLQRELASRSWTPSELSEACRLTVADCRALLSGQAVFSDEAAIELSKALATSQEFWLTDADE